MSALRVFPMPLDRSEAPVTASASVNQLGEFELHNVFGRTLIYTDAPVRLGVRVKGVYLNGNDLFDTGLIVKPGQRIRHVRISLTGRLTEIFGTVRTRSGTLVTDAVVLACPVDPAKWGDPLNRYAKFTRSGPDGRYFISGVPPGEYAVVAADSLDVDVVSDKAMLTRLLAGAARVRIGEVRTRAVVVYLSSGGPGSG